jgi:Rps23 Pro-64 3,4-dihydroxylase Tpa1-like proline 4-hydroxylase
MWRALDEAALARAWREAAPFPHVVVDDFAIDAGALLEILEEEAVERYEGEIALFDASAVEPATADFARLRDSFAASLAPVLSQITGKQVARVDMRAYAYRPGNYLLPHTDHQEGLERLLAYAYYLPTPEPPSGGELELFRCTLVDLPPQRIRVAAHPGEAGACRAITHVESARVIEPRANRLVVFDVGDNSLHQVREVLGGLRLSLAGWFYA